MIIQFLKEIYGRCFCIGCSSCIVGIIFCIYGEDLIHYIIVTVNFYEVNDLFIIEKQDMFFDIYLLVFKIGFFFGFFIFFFFNVFVYFKSLFFIRVNVLHIYLVYFCVLYIIYLCLLIYLDYFFENSVKDLISFNELGRYSLIVENSLEMFLIEKLSMYIYIYNLLFFLFLFFIFVIIKNKLCVLLWRYYILFLFLIGGIFLVFFLMDRDVVQFLFNSNIYLLLYFQIILLLKILRLSLLYIYKLIW